MVFDDNHLSYEDLCAMDDDEFTEAEEAWKFYCEKVEENRPKLKGGRK